jgi:hypothetical protein
MWHDTRFAGPTTQTSRGLRPQAWLPTRCSRPLWCPPRVARAGAATTAHDRGNCATASCWEAPATLRPAGAGVGAPVRPRAARCAPGDTRCPPPPAPRGAAQWGHPVPCPPAPGAPAKQPALPAIARDTPRVQQARATSQPRTAALTLRRVPGVDEAGVTLALTRRTCRRWSGVGARSSPPGEPPRRARAGPSLRRSRRS